MAHFVIVRSYESLPLIIFAVFMIHLACFYHMLSLYAVMYLFMQMLRQCVYIHFGNDLDT